MDCPRCGAHNETDVGPCRSCGASLSEDEGLPTLARKPLAAAPPPAKGASPRLAQGAPPHKPAPALRPRARVSAVARDGSRSADFVLVRDETRVGREVEPGEVKLDKDPFIAPLHAIFRFEGPQLVVKDPGTPNGVFLC